jgi:hypothetical protein
MNSEWRPLDEARKYVKSLGLKTQEDWRAFSKSDNRPKDIPACPDKVYKDSGWVGYGDWLGTKWRLFDEAREYARGLRLVNQGQWHAFSKSGNRPKDIPSNPDQVYKDSGWTGYRDWLGAEKDQERKKVTMNSKNGKWRSFEEARKYARGLGFKDKKEWRAFSKNGNRPKDIPSNPDQVYKDSGWIGMGDWLGNDYENKWRPFKEAREYVRSLGLRTQKDWRAFLKSSDRPKDIPSNPDRFYKDSGWHSLGDWLKGNRPRVDWRPFKEAREYANGLGLVNQKQWQAFAKSSKRPKDIPSSPDRTYKGSGWVDLSDWLGVVNKKEWLPFEEAREYVRGLGLKDQKEWQAFTKNGYRPEGIPSHPDKAYKGSGWAGLDDWLGTINKESSENSMNNNKWRSFEDARKYARSLGLKNLNEWRLFSKSGNRPKDIPSHPDRAYKGSSWAGYSDWVGNGRDSKFNFRWRSFEKAREYVREQGIKNLEEWKAFIKDGKKPEDIPSHPNQTYKDRGWAGYGDWLGTGNVRKGSWRPFEEARKYVRGLGLKGQKEWYAFTKSADRPRDIPAHPSRIYKNSGWIGTIDWLGSKNTRRSNHWLPFEEAREYARSLGIKDQKEWYAFTKGDNRPKNIPSNPSQLYKDSGWLGWSDWIGTNKIQKGTEDMKKAWRSFEEAKKFARTLNFKSSSGWKEFSKTSKRPEDIPFNPQAVYKDLGWAGWSDWLGIESTCRKTGDVTPRPEVIHEQRPCKNTESVCPEVICKDSIFFKLDNSFIEGPYSFQNYEYKHDDAPPSFEEVRAFIKEPSFKAWDDKYKIAFLPFEEAREFVKGLGFKDYWQWVQFAKSNDKPQNIPSHPERTYKDSGWCGWQDWFGTAPLTFEEARKVVRDLRLQSVEDWINFSKSSDKPQNIPSHPERVYRDSGWAGVADWIGIENTCKKDPSWMNRSGLKKVPNNWASFDAARSFARTLNLRSEHEWFKIMLNDNKPKDIPFNPCLIYNDSGWVSWDDWLGVKETPENWRSFKEARKFVWNLGPESYLDWIDAIMHGCKPKDIPAVPDEVYNGSGWKGWDDWFGIAPLPFEEARDFVWALGFTNVGQWIEFSNSHDKPKNIPSHPERVYKDSGWAGIKDWIGVDYIPFEAARDFVRALNLNNCREWLDFAKSEDKPKNIPSDPYRIYKDSGWCGWEDWLGRSNHEEPRISLWESIKKTFSYRKGGGK